MPLLDGFDLITPSLNSVFGHGEDRESDLKPRIDGIRTIPELTVIVSQMIEELLTGSTASLK